MKKKGASEWRAEELRRRIGNRRQSALYTAKYAAGDGEDGDDDAVAGSVSTSPKHSCGSPLPSDGSQRRGVVTGSLLPMLVNAKHNLYAIQSDVFESDARQLAAIRCADRQFTIEKNMRFVPIRELCLGDLTLSLIRVDFLQASEVGSRSDTVCHTTEGWQVERSPHASAPTYTIAKRSSRRQNLR
jgi:hypothetical protein